MSLEMFKHLNKVFAIGVDIGGSHVCSALVNLLDGQVVPESFFETKVDPHASASQIIGQWGDCIKQSAKVAGDATISAIGIAMPGPFDYVNGISHIAGVGKFDRLFGLNIARALGNQLERLGNIPIRFVNDASAFAIGEAWAGVAKGYKRVVSITLGTGFGSSFLQDGVPLSSGSDLPENGWVYCLPYQDSIADDYFSTRWFVGQYKKMTGIDISGVRQMMERTDTQPVVDAIFENFGIRLADFMAPLLKRFEADILVLGGNISNAYPLFAPYFTGQLRKNGVAIKVGVSQLKDSAAITGAARLCNDDFYCKLVDTQFENIAK